MSHLAVRLLADRFTDPDEGINALAPNVPGFIGPVSPATIAVYDELTAPWVARRHVPGPDEAPTDDVSFPCIVIYLGSLSDSMGVTASQSTGARTTSGVAGVVVQLLVRDVDTANGVSFALPLMRAIRGVVHRFNEPSAESAREVDGTRLLPATSAQQGDITAFVEDTILSPGAVLFTFPFLETVPLT